MLNVTLKQESGIIAVHFHCTDVNGRDVDADSNPLVHIHFKAPDALLTPRWATNAGKVPNWAPVTYKGWYYAVINTAGWEPGIYLIWARAIIDGENYTVTGSFSLSSELKLINDIYVDTQQIITDVAGVLAAVQNVDSDLAAHDANLNGRYSSLVAALDAISGKVDSLDTELDTVRSNQATIDGKIDGLVTGLAAVDTELDTVRSSQTSISGKVDSLDTELDTVRANQASILAAIAALEVAGEEVVISHGGQQHTTWADGNYIWCAITVDGTLTDPDSVKLSNSGGTYGIKKRIAGTVLVADGTAMTQVSTGLYRYAYSGLAGYDSTIEYLYAIEVVRGNWTTHIDDQVLPIMGAAVAANTCRVFGDCIDGNGNPLVGITVEASLYRPPHEIIVGGTQYFAIGKDPVSTTTNSAGRFSFLLVQDGIYTISIPELGYKERLSVPLQDEYDLFRGS